MQAVDDDHRRLAEELGPARGRVRPQAARSSSASARPRSPRPRPRSPPTRRSWPPGSPSRRRRRPRRPPKLEADLKAYEATALAKKLADWEKAHAARSSTAGRRSSPSRSSATDGVDADQGARRLDHRLGHGTRTAIVHDRRRDRADRHHRHPARGPARRRPAQQGPRPRDRRQLRAQRVRGHRGPQGRPEAGQAGQARRTPWPTSARTGFDVAKAIDGNRPTRRQRLGRLARRRGSTHWATFETSEPVGRPGGTVLTFKLHHKFNATSVPARPVPALGHPRAQAGRPGPARGLPRRSWPRRPRSGPRPRRTLLLAYFRDDRPRAGGPRSTPLNASQGPAAGRSQARRARRPARAGQAPGAARPAARAAAARRRDEHPAGRHPPAHRRPGHRLGPDQQPGVPVQPLRRTEMTDD